MAFFSKKASKTPIFSPFFGIFPKKPGKSGVDFFPLAKTLDFPGFWGSQAPKPPILGVFLGFLVKKPGKSGFSWLRARTPEVRLLIDG